MLVFGLAPRVVPRGFCMGIFYHALGSSTGSTGAGSAGIGAGLTWG